VRGGALAVADPGLLGWLDAASDTRGIRFAADGDRWDLWTYERLARLTRRTAWGLVEAGVQPGDVVTLLQSVGPPFVCTVFGAMLAGAVPSPLAPPLAFHDPEVYREHATRLLASARPSLLVTEPELAAGAVELARVAGVSRVVGFDELTACVDEERTPPPRERAELALLQFTSGTGGHARGVRVPHAALEANVHAIRDWLRMTEADATASWLPVHHDMGLIGCLLTPAVNRSDLWLMRPEQFVRDPFRYLRCFGALEARLTAMPTFGLDYIARRVEASSLQGLDFSRWRAVIVGAERLDAAALERFHGLLGPFGLRRRALLPSYGLAEATLAVTGLPLDEEWSVARTAGTTGAAPPAVGCGRPLGDTSITIVAADGRPVPDGHSGEIVVRGASVAAGYATGSEPPSLTRFTENGLRSGDAGFVSDGQLFVLGRFGDSLKVRGRTVFAEDLEAILASRGVPRHRVVVLLGLDGGTPTAVALFTAPDPRWLVGVESALRIATGGAAVVVVDAPRGSIARTSSGKPKRRQLWQAFLERRHDGVAVGPQRLTAPARAVRPRSPESTAFRYLR
jgi:acyl-CoA synthetase (AMP-forming)/AMP-acid ligase II